MRSLKEPGLGRCCKEKIRSTNPWINRTASGYLDLITEVLYLEGKGGKRAREGRAPTELNDSRRKPFLLRVSLEIKENHRVGAGDGA